MPCAAHASCSLLERGAFAIAWPSITEISDVHVCKIETLRVAYALAKKSDGVPGIDGVTLDDIEKQGVEALNGGPAEVTTIGRGSWTV